MVSSWGLWTELSVETAAHLAVAQCAQLCYEEAAAPSFSITVSTAPFLDLLGTPGVQGPPF